MRGLPARYLPRWIFLGMMTGALMAILAIAMVVWWMSDVMNRAASDNMVRLFDGAVLDLEHNVEYSARSFTQWRTLYEAVEGRDVAALYRHIGTAVTERNTFDFIYIVDRKGLPIYGFQKGIDRSHLFGFPARLSQLLVEDVIAQESLSEDYKMVTTIARVDGDLAITTAGAVLPAKGLPAGVSAPPILIAGQWLSSTWVTEMGALLEVEDATLSPGGRIARDDLTLLNLYDPSGQIAGTISWRAPTPGRTALIQSLPMILSICAGLLFGSLIVGRVATGLIKAADQQRQRAQTDNLTGLLNRDGLNDRLRCPEMLSALEKRQVAMLYLDLNGFKALNDAEGHDAGDAALRVTADRLRRSLRPNDIIARVGGDEFICIVEGRRPLLAAETVSERILALASDPIPVGRRSYSVIPAIGIAVVTTDETWEDLMRQADTAMYEAKRTNAQAAVPFHPEMTKAA